MEPHPVTDEDNEALSRTPIHHCGEGMLDNGWRYWVARFDGHADPMVSVWAGEGYIYSPTHVWFPNAGAKSVRAWVETLPPPKLIPEKKIKPVEVKDIAA